jgi:hypothetical protein
MGSLYAEGLAESVEDSMIDLRQAILIHLSSNHYPPVHPSFADVALRAIEAASQGRADEDILMPNGLTRSAYFIMEGLHLWSFLPEGDDE